MALCRRCRRPLDTVEDVDGRGELIRVRYQHTMLDVDTGRADHDPDPIMREDAIGSAVTACDFCSAPGPRWTYGCLPFRYEGVNAGSADDWAACDACHDLIEAADWNELAERGMQSMIFHSPTPVPESSRRWMHKKVLGMHRQFASHRTGPPTADEPPGPWPSP